MAENGNLSARQQRAIAALLTSKSVAEAAASAKVGERTLYRWLAEDRAFRAALLAAEGDLLSTTTRRLLSLQGQAIETLESLLSRAESEGVRLRAAQVALELSLKLRDQVSIELRLQALEEGQNGAGW